MSDYRTSDRGIALIKEFEGLRLKAYPDPASGGDPWTIGYGSTSGVKKGLVINESQAETMLRTDLRRFENAVNRAVTADISQHQFDALVSFCFNVGEGNLRKSTLLKKVNAGQFAEAAQEFAKWNKAAGRVMAGLTRRRAAEADLFSA